ncbi:MAG: hypothetical protein U1D35_14955 [Paracoccaceae bacterium]|nr:hypothetical protein [Paracoccaceae bacterium]
MPLPLAPLLPLALRLGAVAAAGWALRRSLRTNLHQGRTDQRAEDALDDLGEGIALHSPADRKSEDALQTNASARLRRTLHWGDYGLELDAAVLGRLRIRKL